MADEEQNVRMPMGDRGHAAERGSNEEDDEMRGAENDDMDDLREDESDEEENYDDDHDDVDDEEEDEISDNGIESEEEEEEEEEDNKMAHNFIRTFSNGNYDAEFDNALSLDRSVLPPARPTQASYNKPDNWIERNRIGLEKVKRQLQTCIDSVTRGNSFDLMLTHNIYVGQLMDNEEPVVWNEPFLDEHWDQLEHALSGDELVTNICNIKIENVELKNFRLATIVDIIVSGRATNSCTQVNFINANLCEAGIISLSELVDVSSKLIWLFLHHNRIDNMDSARCLSRSLKSHNCINHLDLSHCGLGSSPEILLVILQSDVKHIDLESNNIDSLGAIKIAEYLEGDPPIYRIDLGHNRLNDDDAILISQALKRNTNLKTISLHSNNFTSIGVKALFNCLFDSSSLNAISESNHTLTGMFMFYSHNCYNGGLLELDRAQKILLALQDTDSLLKYLANVPVKLMPEVLAFPNQHVDDDLVGQDEHLNIVYSTMRWWNMPLLYSNHCVKSDTKRKRDSTM
jgi:Ran GTPase-activating protein (RanGAP) involved in mRNA processing and transport